MNIITIIPARGGSKGIPQKNIRPLCGKPMVAWNIEAALTSKFISKVYVSTDDNEIAAASRSHGAHIIDRPKELANDTATSESALLHALNFLKKKKIFPDLMVFTQCTSPLTTGEDIDNAIQKLLDKKADSCFTATDFHYFVWKKLPDGSVEGINHDKQFRPRRQDREPQYQDNGAVYVMNCAGFMQARHRFFGKTVMSLMPQERCFEIDNPIDLDIASVLLRKSRMSLKR